jgi:hypothetical protein
MGFNNPLLALRNCSATIPTTANTTPGRDDRYATNKKLAVENEILKS